MANLRLAASLADVGHTVDVITYPFGSNPNHPGVNVHRCRNAPFVRSVGIGFSAAKVLLDVNLFFYAFRLIRENNFDCIHGVEEGASIGAVIGHFFGIPVIYDMDSVMSYEVANSKFGKLPLLVWLMRAVERWTIRNSALVMTICEAMAKEVYRIAPSKRVVIIPDVPIPSPPGGVNPDRARSNIPPRFVDGRKIIMYTGSLAGYQGMELLISAMKQVAAIMPEVALIVLGGDEKNIERLKRFGKTVGVMDNLLFMGKRSPEEIPDFLGAADVLASPRRGGINPPAKIYTYMQAGKPIVATNAPAHTAVLSSDAAFLVDPEPGAIATGILDAFSNPEEAKRKALQAQKMVRESTPEKQARMILEAYELLYAQVHHPATSE